MCMGLEEESAFVTFISRVWLVKMEIMLVSPCLLCRDIRIWSVGATRPCLCGERDRRENADRIGVGDCGSVETGSINSESRATGESREGPCFTEETTFLRRSPSLVVWGIFLSLFSLPSGWCWFLAGVGWRVNGVRGLFMFWCPCAFPPFFLRFEFGEGGLKRVVVIWQPCYLFKTYSDSSQTPRSLYSEDEQK
jgi:hypothetical protein